MTCYATFRQPHDLLKFIIIFCTCTAWTPVTWGWCFPTSLHIIETRLSRISWSRLVSLQSLSSFLIDTGQILSDDPFIHAMDKLAYTTEQKDLIMYQLRKAGLWNVEDNTRMLETIAAGFDVSNTAAISTLLIQDFGFTPLEAHQVRAALQTMKVIEEKKNQESYDKQISCQDYMIESSMTHTNSVLSEATIYQPKIHKTWIINKVAMCRKNGLNSNYEYGLPRDYKEDFPLLASQLDDFFKFMTLPSTEMQGEMPLRKATASVYLNHAKLFLGWYRNYFIPDCEGGNSGNMSIYLIFPTIEKDSVDAILIFLHWLRSNRQISVSYEANLLRGLIKLLKFRFRKECSIDTTHQNFADLPILQELRKWHNDANRRQRVAPRVTDEDRKWISWSSYLSVVQYARSDLLQMIEQYELDYSTSNCEQASTPSGHRGMLKIRRERAIAFAFQKYLIVAFFACIPDRQRTIRELELGRTLVKNNNNQYTIKHTPEDYKTGNTYGERPPLTLPIAMTTDIDEFVKRWRPFLGSSTKGFNMISSEHLFLQVRTGKCLTADSVYQIVSAVCYHYTGKRTNPHLLRDMIVTHVRESTDTSEQQMEALALLMGHSVSIQRKSYDRRSLTKKIEPAFELMNKVNAACGLGLI